MLILISVNIVTLKSETLKCYEFKISHLFYLSSWVIFIINRIYHFENILDSVEYYVNTGVLHVPISIQI